MFQVSHFEKGMCTSFTISMKPKSSKSGKFLSRGEKSWRDKASETLLASQYQNRDAPGTFNVTPSTSVYASTTSTGDDDVTTPPIMNREIPWDEGVRLVNLGVLAQGLDSCSLCRNHLRLVNCEGETKYGGGSILHVPCKHCGTFNNVYTSKTSRTAGKKYGMSAFDINTKIATGMIHAGIGERHVNSLFSSISLPTIHEKTLKRKERAAGEAITKVAKRSCEHALRGEISNSKKARIDVSFDGGWQKRGSGRDYKSLSGAQGEYVVP
ncbi:uncharacterized protein [Ptychodera flava]|uniref:uncharacterized protein n=2 Tax=Ptychodera flava TaxID=63121 RepID=UPI00396A24E7